MRAKWIDKGCRTIAKGAIVKAIAVWVPSVSEVRVDPGVCRPHCHHTLQQVPLYFQLEGWLAITGTLWLVDHLSQSLVFGFSWLVLPLIPLALDLSSYKVFGFMVHLHPIWPYFSLPNYIRKDSCLLRPILSFQVDRYFQGQSLTSKKTWQQSSPHVQLCPW